MTRKTTASDGGVVLSFPFLYKKKTRNKNKVKIPKKIKRKTHLKTDFILQYNPHSFIHTNVIHVLIVLNFPEISNFSRRRWYCLSVSYYCTTALLVGHRILQKACAYNTRRVYSEGGRGSWWGVLSFRVCMCCVGPIGPFRSPNYTNKPSSTYSDGEVNNPPIALRIRTFRANRSTHPSWSNKTNQYNNMISHMKRKLRTVYVPVRII